MYLMPGREAASTLVPGDLGVSQPSNKAVQIQALPFCHVGGQRLDSDRRGDPECRHRACRFNGDQDRALQRHGPSLYPAHVFS